MPGCWLSVMREAISSHSAGTPSHMKTDPATIAKITSPPRTGRRFTATSLDQLLTAGRRDYQDCSLPQRGQSTPAQTCASNMQPQPHV